MSSTRDDGTHRLAAVVAVLVGAGLCALSVTVAYRFGAILGITDTDKNVLGLFGAAIILGKNILPFTLTAAFRQRRWVFWFLAVAATVATVSYSLTSSYGYGAAQRSVAEVAQDKVELSAEDLYDLPRSRPAAAIKPLIAAERNKTNLAKLKSELAIAEQREAARTRVMNANPGPSSEAQVHELADFSRLSPSSVRASLTGCLAVAFELLEFTMFVGAAMLWGESEPAPKERESVSTPEEISVVETQAPKMELKPVESQPDPVVKLRPAAKKTARVTLRSWIEGHLDSVSSTTPMTAYKAYAKEFKARRRAVATEFKFSRMLAEVAAQRGLTKETQAGRIRYERAA